MSRFRDFSASTSVRPNLGTSLRNTQGKVNIGGLSVAASSGAKEMLGDPKNGFFPVVLGRLKDGFSKASGGVLATKTLRAMITREGAVARVNATGPYTCPEVEKVSVGEEFLALGETIKGRKGSYFRISQIIPRAEYEKMTEEQKAQATAGATAVNPAALNAGDKAGAEAA